MESNSVCNQTSDQQNRTTVKRESDSLITSMITDRIARHEVLLPINHNQYNFRKKKTSRTNISNRNNIIFKVNIFPFWKFPSFYPG